MKPTQVFLIAAIGMVAALTLFAGSAAAQTTLANTSHNLSSTGQAGAPFNAILAANESICKPCHSPHSAQAAADIPLQNRSPSATTSTYNFFDGVRTATRDGLDLVCMSCHDGTIAVDAFGGAAGTPANEMDTAASYALLTGTALDRSHPTGSTVLLTNIPVAERGAATNVKLFGATSDQVQCASCHDPHTVGPDGAGTAGTSGASGWFLRTLAADLCNECHVK